MLHRFAQHIILKLFIIPYISKYCIGLLKCHIFYYTVQEFGVRFFMFLKKVFNAYNKKKISKSCYIVKY